MRIGSLCSGYGGLDAAVREVLGGELAFTADIDPGACALLAHRFPGVPNLGDIKAVDWFSLGTVGILCGGYPCQGFSAAGKRLGATDERYLWPHFAAAISALRPPLVVLENVQGHLTLGFDRVLADLAAIGYDAEWVVVTASAAGAPHRRARLFVLAFPSGRAITGVPVAVIRDGAWLKPDESLFGMVPFSGRVPQSGSMAAGRVYAAEDRPAGMAAGLLKTPIAQLAVNGGSQHPDKRRAGGHGPTLVDQVEHDLLPTPMTGYSQRTPEEWRAGRPAGNGGTRERVGDLGIVAEHLLPTPQATDGQGGPRALPERRTSRGKDHGPRLRDMAPALLPTPSAADGTGGHKTRSGNRKGEALLGGIGMLLPTPTAQDSSGARNATANRSPGSAHHAGTTLCDVFHQGADGTGQSAPLAIAAQAAGGTDWGLYENAVRRWEAVTGRPAPPPTIPGKTGLRLNPALPEWMMGLPAGWITDVPGLSRNAKLKLAGSGVVPQQCALALMILLPRAGFAANWAGEAA